MSSSGRREEGRAINLLSALVALGRSEWEKMESRDKGAPSAFGAIEDLMKVLEFLEGCWLLKSKEQLQLKAIFPHSMPFSLPNIKVYHIHCAPAGTCSACKFLEPWERAMQLLLCHPGTKAAWLSTVQAGGEGSSMRSQELGPCWPDIAELSLFSAARTKWAKEMERKGIATGKRAAAFVSVSGNGKYSLKQYFKCSRKIKSFLKMQELTALQPKSGQTQRHM